MQVKFLYDPIKPSDLFNKNLIPVLPLFMSAAEYDQYRFGDLELMQVKARSYIERSGVRFIALPESLTVMILVVSGRHSKRRILHNAKRLYQSVVDSIDVTGDFRGLADVELVPYHGIAPHVQKFHQTTRGVVVATGDDEQDAYLRSILRQPEFSTYTSRNLKHPGVIYAFESALARELQSKGLDITFNWVSQYGNRVLISAEVFDDSEFDD